MPPAIHSPQPSDPVFSGLTDKRSVRPDSTDETTKPQELEHQVMVQT